MRGSDEPAHKPVSLTLLVLLATVGAVACGPLVILPGGRLSGEVKPAPDDWSFSDSVETIQLETRPTAPYSVNVWGVGVGSAFYIAAGDPESRWAGYIDEDPQVRLRIGAGVYEMRAIETRDADDRAAFLAAVKAKYGWEPEADQAEQALLYRLEPR